MLNQSSYPLLASLLTGVTYGFAYCGPSCGPFLCTYIMGSDPNGLSALKSMTVFSAARVITYGIAGAASALLGTTILALHGSSTMVLGVVVVLIGGLMWRKPGWDCDSHASTPNGRPRRSRTIHCLGRHAAPPLWMAGVAFALTPCPPMLAMLAYAASAGSPSIGAATMMLFGLGTAISPLLLTCVLAGYCSGRLRRLAPQHAFLFRRTASLTLVALGCAMLFSGA